MIKCEKCNRDAEIFTRKNGNKYSETFYTDTDGKMVCIDCLGEAPKTLHEIQAERIKEEEEFNNWLDFKQGRC